MWQVAATALLVTLVPLTHAPAAEPPVPQTAAELWAAFDATAKPLDDWHRATELGFTPADKALEDGGTPGPWKGEIPQFRDLRWLGGEFVPRPKPYL